MKTIADFKATLSADQPGDGWPAPLKSLWYDAKGDWNKAHAQVDQMGDAAAAWVHAYLHRKEGDLTCRLLVPMGGQNPAGYYFDGRMGAISQSLFEITANCTYGASWPRRLNER